MKMGTCADCGRPMHRGTTSLPQGEARCRECRKANPQPRVRTTPKTPPPHKAMACAGCGRAIWKGPKSRPEGEARCQACRRMDPPWSAAHLCPDCGVRCYGEYCHPCRSRRQIVRAPDDERLLRHQRENDAPGLNSYARSKMLAKWKRQGKRCAYCPNPADTIDHVVPLVRGGTNYEGNLVPSCRRCNSSKGARILMEWRTGKSAPRMAKPIEWKRSRKPKPIKAIKGEQDEMFNVCVCGTGYMGRAQYCSAQCRSRSTYRLRVGIPLGAAPYEVKASA